jgi:hypothetical protein
VNALDSALAHLLQAQERHIINRLDELHAQAAVDSYPDDIATHASDMDEDLNWLHNATSASLASATVMQAAAQEYNALVVDTIKQVVVTYRRIK